MCYIQHFNVPPLSVLINIQETNEMPVNDHRVEEKQSRGEFDRRND